MIARAARHCKFLAVRQKFALNLYNFFNLQLVAMITKEQVLNALRNVEDPDLKKDLVTLNMIENLHIEGNKVSFAVVLTTPACPMKTMIENACRNAIKHFVSKDAELDIHMTSRVTTAAPQSTLSNIKNIIVVTSGKGGVGKSTVSANLALGLAQSGAKVGLIDADVYGPSIPIMFGVTTERPQSVETEGGKMSILPIEKHGVKLLSIGFFTDPHQPVPWRGPMASNAIKQLFNDANWGELDYLIVDLPPGTGDIHITITQSFPISGAVVVTTPQNVASADTRKGVRMFLMEGMKVPLLGVIENMAYFTPEELPNNKYYIFGSKNGGKRLAEEFDIPFLGEIPLIQSISDAGDDGKPAVLQNDHLTAKLFVKLAEQVAQQVAIQNAKNKP